MLPVIFISFLPPSFPPSLSQSYKRAWQSAQAKLHNLEKEQEKKQRQANKHLGVFSTYGVDEAKKLFWRSFKWGKSFGQRQTMFDMLFMGFRAMRRDEGLLEYTLQVWNEWRE